MTACPASPESVEGSERSESKESLKTDSTLMRPSFAKAMEGREIIPGRPEIKSGEELRKL